MIRLATLLLSATCLFSLSAHGEIPGNLVRVGVLTDMNGPFSDGVGPGSVAAAKLAAQDFAPESGGLQVEIIAADHQNKPDIGSGIARRWFDQEGVSAIVDLPNSGVALAVAGVAHKRNKVALTSSSMTSDLIAPEVLSTLAGQVDGMFALAGAHATIALPDLDTAIAAINPRIVIPMHYWHPRGVLKIDPVERFLERYPQEIVDRIAETSVRIDPASLPETRRIVVLDQAR